MTLPWYVALDRWVRRNPTTAQTLKGIGALVIVLSLVVLLKNQTAVEGLVTIALSVWVYLATVMALRGVLEVAADKWREEH